MDLGQDTHLCLRCGKTIDGLDNYVTHRQKKCLQPSPSSSFPPDPAVEPPTPFPSASQDIYKISANDFFLNLNLQYNAKTSFTDLTADAEKDSSTTTDGFSSKLEIPSLESDLNPVFSADKPLIMDDTSSSDIDYINISSEKLENFKINNQLNECSQTVTKVKKVCDSVEKETTSSLSSALKGTAFMDSNENSTKVSLKRSKKKTLKKYGFTNFSALNVPRTSYRQKLNANDRMLCCDVNQDCYYCFLCDQKYLFAFTFLDHLLICSKKQSDMTVWKQQIFKNGSLFAHSSQFKCLLCSFYCSDSFMFLSHLKTPNHRQKTASLKNPLICLPCQDECSASDEMKEHFSKCHLQYKRGDHPIIITEKKRNLHCCYCLTLIKSSNHLHCSNIDDPLVKHDISFIRNSLPNICACACGVDKQTLNNFLTNTSPLITPKSSEAPKNVSLEGSAESNDSLQANKLDELVIQENKNGKTNLDVYHEIDLSLKEARQRIIAKITSKNGKFIYKKVRMPDSKKEWTCCWCGVEYISKLTLQAHLDKCGLKKKNINKNSFKSNQNFKTNSCETDKKYLCDKCPYIGKSFNQLTRHSRSHSGEKPYKCPYCTYSSSLSSQLVRHKRLHTGQKPYKCPYCKYTCNTQENLRKHILKTKKHKGKMMYPCQHCSYESNEFSEFKSHLLKIHSIDFPNGITSPGSSTHSDEIPGL